MKTGITQWNILCRWAFCLSLRQPAPPTPVEVPADSSVEMSWPIFAGGDPDVPATQEAKAALERLGAASP